MPGDQMKLEASIVYHKRGMWRFKVRATVDDQLVSEAELNANIAHHRMTFQGTFL